MSDPLMPHLIDILRIPDLQELILTGGFGIRLKQDYLARIDATTLIMPVPPARATQDIDLFLKMEIFLDSDKKARVRAGIDKLEYKPIEANWQFGKPLGGLYPDRQITLDFLARHPTQGEKVRLKPPRVGSGALHGRNTEEAFAIEVDAIRISVVGQSTDGEFFEGSVLVPHPYSWLNMKVRAAYDWLRMERGLLERKEFSEKHPFDVYALVAMLQASELSRSAELAHTFNDHEVATAIREEALELFSKPSSPGSIEARRQVGSEFNFETFYSGLTEALGMGLDTVSKPG